MAAINARLCRFSFYLKVTSYTSSPDQKRYQESGADYIKPGASAKFVEHREAQEEMLLILIKNFSSSAGGAACSHH